MSALSMIRISIMRLKRNRPTPPDPLHLTINDKNLNYEIETTISCGTRHDSSISINDKNLNYEIETGQDVKIVIRAQSNYQ